MSDPAAKPPAMICPWCHKTNACRHNHLPLTIRHSTPEFTVVMEQDYIMVNGKLEQRNENETESGRGDELD